MKKKKASKTLLGLSLLSIGLWGCSTGGTAAVVEIDSDLELKISTAGRTMAGDQFGLRVTGQGMAPFLWSGAVAEEVRLEGIPPGEDRLVEGWIETQSGRQAFHGEKTTDLFAGNNSLVLQLSPQFASLLATIPLGLGNPSGVAGGMLTLSRTEETISSPLEIGSYKARFFVERLFYGDDWLLQVAIWASSGDTLFALTQNIAILPNSPKEVFLDLSSLQSELELTIQLGDAENFDFTLNLPNKLTRGPLPNELLFSELIPNPKVSGDPFEFIELANLSKDTLKLDSCSIRKTRGATALTTRIDFPEGIKIAPLERFVLGRDSVQFADWNYTSFSLTNTTQALLLICREVAIDSLVYYPSNDASNPFPFKEKHSMELDLDQWEVRHLGSSWRMATDSLEMGGWWAFGTPGR